MKVFEQAIEDENLTRNLHDRDKIISAIKDIRNDISEIKENVIRHNKERLLKALENLYQYCD